MWPAASQDGVDADVRREVARRLDRVEHEEDVRVLYACESGSRAWGFPTADSDYDVRFVYAHRPAWYLSIELEHRRDVIERPIEDAYDVSGWDVRKALGLMRKSNPSLLEWLQSPIVYRTHEEATRRLRALVETCYSPRAAHHHYLSMARGNYRDYLKGETVRTKKYFYVLRPLLAVRWIESEAGAVPTAFGALMARTVQDADLEAAVARLLEQKRAGTEMDRGPRVPVLSDFIHDELARHEARTAFPAATKPPVAPLDAAFRAILDDVWP